MKGTDAACRHFQGLPQRRCQTVQRRINFVTADSKFRYSICLQAVIFGRQVQQGSITTLANIPDNSGDSIANIDIRLTLGGQQRGETCFKILLILV